MTRNEQKMASTFLLDLNAVLTSFLSSREEKKNDSLFVSTFKLLFRKTNSTSPHSEYPLKKFFWNNNSKSKGNKIKIQIHRVTKENYTINNSSQLSNFAIADFRLKSGSKLSDDND